MNTSKKQSESTSELKRRRTANRNAVIVMALLFVALISGSGATSDPSQNLSAGDIAWGALSILGFGGLVWSLYISYRQSDERQQLVQLKATAATFLIVIFSLVAAQILHALDVVSMLISVQVIIIGGILIWNSLSKIIEYRSK